MQEVCLLATGRKRYRMKLKKLELQQEAIENLTRKAENQQAATNNPDCSFIISCPHPCLD